MPAFYGRAVNVLIFKAEDGFDWRDIEMPSGSAQPQWTDPLTGLFNLILTLSFPDMCVGDIWYQVSVSECMSTVAIESSVLNILDRAISVIFHEILRRCLSDRLHIPERTAAS